MPQRDRATGRRLGQDPRSGPKQTAAAPEILGSCDRLAALRDADLVDSPPEPVFDRLTALAQRLLGAPVILMSLVETERQYFKSFQGLPEPWASRRGTPLSHSFCQHVVGSRDALIINDAQRYPLMKDHAAIAELGVAAYLGVPLITPGGQVLGSFCAIDSSPRIWTAQDVIDLADLAAVAAVEVASRQLLRERERIEQKMQVLVGELDHRIRNLLTVVQAIARQSGSEGMSAKEFLDTFCSRLRCLAVAHATLVESQYRSAGLPQIAHGSLAAHLGRIRLELPDRHLEPERAMTLALLLHELATNAVKYGALSVPEGRVTLIAELDSEPHLVLVWREEGGPPVAPPTSNGFGMRMLQASVAPRGGSLELDWRREGLVCRMRLAGA